MTNQLLESLAMVNTLLATKVYSCHTDRQKFLLLMYP